MRWIHTITASLGFKDRITPARARPRTVQHRPPRSRCLDFRPWQIVGPALFFLKVHAHALQHPVNGLQDRGDGHIRKRFYKLRVAQGVVGAAGLDDLGLLFHGEALVLELRIDVLLVEVQDLMVRDRARVAEVVHAREAALGHRDRDGHEVVQHGHGVGDVHNAAVLADLGDEVARAEVVADRHAHAETEDVRNVPKQLLQQALGEGVEGAGEVGPVHGIVLLEGAHVAPGAVLLQDRHRVVVVVFEDTARGEQLSRAQRADDVGADGLQLVILAPVHIRPARHPGGAQDVRGLLAVQLRFHALAVLEPNAAHYELLSLRGEQVLQHAAQPAVAAVDEELHARSAVSLAVALVQLRLGFSFRHLPKNSKKS
eukprot:scaffold1944_cov241-Pinguiococcus_pyrenoidosus.AAC.16